MIGALLGGALLTVVFFQTTINTKIFDQWVAQDLIKHLPEESVVVLDNATFHKGAEMKKALKDNGHTLVYLPVYSPDLNPIEHKWAQAKARRRKNRCSIDSLFLFNDA